MTDSKAMIDEFQANDADLMEKRWDLFAMNKTNCPKKEARYVAYE